MDHKEAIEANRASWDQRVPVHLRSADYRRVIAELEAGRPALMPPTDREVGDVAGKRVLHVQCHFGLDTLSLAMLGAEATGLDFSEPAIEAARAMSAHLGVAARFVVGNALEADAVLAGEKFDMVFASFGVFCWVSDLPRWIDAAANLLRPGGVLYIADGHPLADVFESDPTARHGIDFHYGYFQREPIPFGPGPTYADDGSEAVMPGTIEFLHPLGEFVTAAANAGLGVESLHEFAAGFFGRFAPMIRQPDRTWRLPEPLDGKLPLVFSMRAVKG